MNKQFVIKLLRNIFVSVVFALLVWCGISKVFEDKLVLDVSTNSSTRIEAQVPNSKPLYIDCDNSSAVQRTFKQNVDFRKMSFTISAQSSIENVKINSITLYKLPFFKTLLEISRIAPNKYICVDVSKRLGVIPTLAKPFYGLLFLFIFSGIVATFFQFPPMPRKELIIQSSSVTALFAFFFCLVVPLQSFLANQSDFSFSVWRLIRDRTIAFMLLFIIGDVVLYYMTLVFGRVVLYAIIGLVFCGYLQVGILSYNLPLLNGAINSTQTNKVLMDSIVLFIAFCLPILTLRWTKSYLHYIAFGLMFLCGASIFDANTHTYDINDLPTSLHMYTPSSVADNTMYSQQKNVIILILDSITSEVSLECLAQKKEYIDSLYGFTAYTNNLGMHQSTEPAAPGILRGKYFKDSHTYIRFTHSLLSEDSIITLAAQENNTDVYATFGSSDIGVMSKELKINQLENKPLKSPYKERIDGVFAWSIEEITIYKLVPYALKNRFVNMFFRRWMALEHDTCSSESSLYEKLANAPIDEQNHLVFHHFHTWGSHPPLMYDKTGCELNVFNNPIFGS